MNNDYKSEPNVGEMESPDDLNILAPEEDVVLRRHYEHRLLLANLQTEAVRAGMIDLDGLKMMDLSTVTMGNDDKIVGGQKLMEDLRRIKPWLFRVSSSSSAASVPASQPARQKMALEMTDEEYSSARAAITKYRF